MFLRKLVLQGFKSFADRTEFEFGPGMSAIVGPNGCGKSNILDSVRWVLGEQSARSLRGSKMLDVVFNGSRGRKPATFAEVELTFDNSSGFLASDEREVVVSRTLYRSGESEYRLNGNACRLKDVRDLLLDTGVGVDAYSIIEQGRVDLMLQANPVQRRELFEEAAGISRYKVRRDEAQRKLERTQSNLLRLNDVLDELERQLRSVKLAAGKARRWQEHDQRLRELRSSFSLAEFHELQRGHDAQRAQIAGLEGVLAALQAELAGRDAAVSALDHRIQQLDENVRAAEASLAALQSEANGLSERIAQSARRIEDLEQARATAELRIGQTEERHRELSAQVQQQESELQQIAALLDAAGRRTESLRSARGQVQHNVTRSRQALESARNVAFDAARRASLLHNEQQSLAQQRERTQAQLKQLESRQAQLALEIEEHARSADNARRQVAEGDARAAALAQELREQDQARIALESELERAGQEIVLCKERRSGVLSRLHLLEELEARREGVGQGARWILDWQTEAGTPPGSVIGLVADLIQIDDPRVHMLQNVLARFENYIVVGDSHAFLAELSRRGEPPAALDVIALDRLSAEGRFNRFADAPGVLARAADWVRCDPAMRPLAESLLGRVLLVDSVERALAVASDAPDGFAFVTEQGHTIEAGGRMTFGRGNATGGLISRKAQIRQLRSDLDEAETALEQATRLRTAAEERRSDLGLRRDALLDQIAQQQREHAQARTDAAREAESLVRLEREGQLLEGERASIGRLLAEMDARTQAMEAQRQAAEQESASRASEIEALDAELTRLEASVAELSQELTAAEVDAGRTLERRRARQGAIDALRAQLAQLQAEHESAARSVQEAAARLDQARSERSEAEARVERVRADAAEAQRTVLAVREQRQLLRRRREAGEATVRRMRGEVEELERALSARQVALREIEVRREALVTRVREELSLDLVELYATYRHAEQDWDSIREEIEDLRGKIARLGHVNLDAIAELEELTPRYENLAAQREDLLSSIRQLETLIGELDAESRARFEKTFVEIRENFIELFRRLFGGGRADILLENPANPLECGIEIIARPPGKEPQSLSLLSGGEKTLTAVALLFAVFRSKPSPFAILDEVDAALDEANIDRFNRMLMDFLSESQFIVITHNKRTMQSADVLYGITMQEPGVSKRVSVRFEDRAETPIVA